MKEKEFRLNQLRQYQALPLSGKIRLSEMRIREWVEEFGQAGCYISMSGGKDSWVLANIVWSLFPKIPAVFADTGNELNSILKFVQSKIDEGYPIEVVKPKYTFEEIIEKYGYPVISKEQAGFINEYRTTRSDKLRDLRWNGRENGRSKISEKWRFAVEAPFKITNKCCKYLKCAPCSQYEKRTNRLPFVGTMADESQLRRQSYMKYGCNAFDSKKSKASRPLMFWTDQDVLAYIQRFGIGIADCYGEIIKTPEGLKTTGEERTGCKLCLYGAHKDDVNRVQRLAITEPETYRHAIDALGYDKVMSFMGIDFKPPQDVAGRRNDGER